MIRFLFSSAFFFCLGAAATYFAAGHHVVKTADGTLVVPRTEIAFTDIYVDITAWTPEDFRKHPKLAEALMKDGRGDLVSDSVIDELRRTVNDWFKGDKK
jgi:hypothetical protein